MSPAETPTLIPELIVGLILTAACIVVFLVGTRRRIRAEYTQRYEALNRRCGNLLPPVYDPDQKEHTK
jgi:uncharacterized protein (DUF2062 family)